MDPRRDPPAILIVEDEGVIALDLARALRELGYRVAGSVKSGEEAVAQAEALRPDLVLMDIHLAGAMDGVAAAQEIRRRFDLPVVYLTAFADDETLARATQAEAHGYLVKPFREPALRSAIEVALHTHAAERRLRAREARLAQTLRAMGAPVIATDAEARIAYLNPSAEALAGWAPGEAVGKLLAEVLAPAADAAAGGARLIARDGETIAVDDVAAPIVDEQGAVVGDVVVLRDARPQAAADEVRRANAALARRVLERTTQLDAASRELATIRQAFAHELRGPLRAIDGFSRGLLDDPGAALGGRARADLERVRAAAQRMASQIDDLLALGHVAQLPLVRRPIDVGALAAEIAADLRAEQPAHPVELVVAADLRAEADPVLLRIALTHLLDNAWKFTRGVRAPRVEVLAVVRDGRPGIAVRDNGIGFDPAYAAQIFGAFTRLQLAEEYPGNGIGLAIVQRIVERHGGAAWAEGAVGGGATVGFTLG